MDTRMRLQMERAQRVVGFSREHPSELPGYLAAVSRLEDRLARTREMADQETTGRLAGRATIAERTALGQKIVADLQLLAGIARTAGVEAVGTELRIRFPGPQRNQVQFLSGARVALATARRHQELLTGLGLPENHLATLGGRLGAYEALLEQREEAVRSRMGARSQFGALAREMRVLVEQLHAINRHRFQADAGAYTVWRSTRDLRVGSRKAGEAAPTALIGAATPIALPPGQPLT